MIFWWFSGDCCLCLVVVLFGWVCCGFVDFRDWCFVAGGDAWFAVVFWYVVLATTCFVSGVGLGFFFGFLVSRGVGTIRILPN